MTSTQRALHKAVQMFPDDDEPRRMYAAYLQDECEPQQMEQAEFIRVQVELAPLDAIDTGPDGGASGPEHLALRRREHKLLRDNWTDWHGLPEIGWTCRNLTGRLPDRVRDANSVEFRRGWPAILTLSWADWLRTEKVVYWRPVPCGGCPSCRPDEFETGCQIRCSGSGEVLPTDECGECGGSGQQFGDGTRQRPYGHRPAVECTHCTGGRVPRECPETASPLTTINITDDPIVRVGLGTGVFQGWAIRYGSSAWYTTRDDAETAIRSMWPRLQIHLRCNHSNPVSHIHASGIS